MELIEREALVEAFVDADPDVMVDYGPDYGSEWGFSREAVAKIIQSLPTIDAAPVVRARWRTKRGSYITGGGDPLWECSRCEYIYGASLLPPKYHYCPNCGARMGGKGHG